MNVKFFPHKHTPSDEKKKELAKIQEDIHFQRVDFNFAIRLDPHHIKLKRKLIFHEGFRKQWKVWLGGRSEEKGQGVG